MNWTEGSLYRHNRGRLRKVNPVRQRQKEYFARARARAAERKAAEENGHPPISYLQQSDSPSSSQCSYASRRSGSSSGRRASLRPSGKRTEMSGKQSKSAPKTNDNPLPTISRFFQERSNGETATSPQAEYDEEALERMRQKLLARKD